MSLLTLLLALSLASTSTAQDHTSPAVFGLQVFAATTDITPPVISSISVTNITTDSVTINWTTDEPADGQIELINPCLPGCFWGLSTVLSLSHSATLSNLSADTQYAYRIRSRDGAGNLGLSLNQLLKTSPLGQTSTFFTLWSNAVLPTFGSYPDARAIEVGVKFRSDVAGIITAIRFYKGPKNTGIHTVSLWTNASSVPLARAVALSSDETASGWQVIPLPAPVAISPGVVYIASYHTTSGYYAYTDYYFLNQWDSGPLHAIRDGAPGGPNPLFSVSPVPTFPDSTWHSGNFWVDVVFLANSSCGMIMRGPTTVLVQATDDVGVAGVQFKLDGSNLGSEITAPPYQLQWDTRQSSNGCHSLAALARDAAGNNGSASISVQVSN